MKTSNKNNTYNKQASSDQLYSTTQFNNKLLETKKNTKVQEV